MLKIWYNNNYRVRHGSYYLFYGKDKVGIIAKVSNILAEHGVNILNINQNIMEGFFNMVLIADMTGAAVKLQDLKDIFTALGRDIGVEIRVQSEEIFTAMHRI